MAPGQLAEKVNFACEAGVCNPFFASALPRQKTLLSVRAARMFGGKVTTGLFRRSDYP